MKYGPFVRSFKLENFKAIQKIGAVAFTPMTVLIGNNGSGKSSLIEGLETYRSIVVDGLDTAMQRWFGMDHVWNKRARHNPVGVELTGKIQMYENPIRFIMRGMADAGSFRASMTINAKPGRNGFFIEAEALQLPSGVQRVRDASGTCVEEDGSVKGKVLKDVDPGESTLPPNLRKFVQHWQFLSLSPGPMGIPAVKQMATNGTILLNRDGSNLAQYLLGIRAKDTAAFEGIVEAMQFVLDYAQNFEPVETREIQPTMYLKMLEQVRDKNIEIPGWLISTGTLRILALLAVLRNPDPPPLIVVEEIENGLDPRTIHMILEEIKTVVQSGRSQVILTTHSPYLLDLLPLQTLVLVERDNGGNPVFWRPSDSNEVQDWAKSFAPGQLYTTGRFKREVHS
ncbi:MAG: AAA family ATPase [Kiritimatiellia bacterium]|nr:AAA family ATPase [Kiritimatiellia bacterium]